ncbi:MAG: YfhO family protein [Candidatus Levybacteria bacterium]|nr:YfhO family protein [Candidatus Levybacteria bacterium]
MKRWAINTTALIFLALLPLLFFYKAFFGYLIISGDFSGSDLLDLHLPFKQILHERISDNMLPLWDPDLSLGFPVLAESQTGIFYPVNFVFAYVSPYIALNGSIIAVFIISLLSTFWYLRLLGRSIAASLFGSIAFSFSAFYITRFKHINMVHVASMFPLLFCMTRSFFEGQKLRYLLFTGFILAFMIFAGHAQMAFYSILIFLTYVVFECIRVFLLTKKAVIVPLAAVYVVNSFTIAVGLTAIQTLPSLELLGLTERPTYAETILTAYPFSPKHLITLFSPYYFGNPAIATYRENVVSGGIFWENSSYFGIIPLFLALFWIVRIITMLGKKIINPRGKHSMDLVSYYFLFLAFISFVIILGRNTPVFLALTKLIPLFNLFRFPTRLNLFLIFSLVVLSATALDFLLAKISQKYKSALIAIIFTVLIFDLYVFANAYVSFIPIGDFLKNPAPLAALSKEKEAFRIYSMTQYGEGPYRSLGWVSQDAHGAISAFRQSIPPNNNVFYHIASFTDRAWFEGGLGIKRRTRLEKFLLSENQNTALTGKLLGLFNVKYILSFRDSIGIEINKIKDYDLGKSYAGKLNLFENYQNLPRAFFVPEANIIKDEESVFTAITDINFLPNRTVILEDKPKKLPPEFSGVLDEFHKQNPVKIISYKQEEVIIEADIKQHGFLVLSDTDYPGWNASVNGKEARILKADYLIRAVELFPGKNKVVMKYDPFSFKLGALVSSTTAFLIIASVLLYCLYRLALIIRR